MAPYDEYFRNLDDQDLHDAALKISDIIPSFLLYHSLTAKTMETSA